VPTTAIGYRQLPWQYGSRQSLAPSRCRRRMKPRSAGVPAPISPIPLDRPLTDRFIDGGTSLQSNEWIGRGHIRHPVIFKSYGQLRQNCHGRKPGIFPASAVPICGEYYRFSQLRGRRAHSSLDVRRGFVARGDFAWVSSIGQAPPWGMSVAACEISRTPCGPLAAASGRDQCPACQHSRMRSWTRTTVCFAE
jgi:hypothetical protein